MLKIKWKFVQFRSKKLSTNWSTSAIGVGPNCPQPSCVRTGRTSILHRSQCARGLWGTGFCSFKFAKNARRHVVQAGFSRFFFFFRMEISGMMCLTCWEWLERYHISVSVLQGDVKKAGCHCESFPRGNTSTLQPTANISWGASQVETYLPTTRQKASPRISQREGSSVSTPSGGTQWPRPASHYRRCDGFTTSL